MEKVFDLLRLDGKVAVVTGGHFYHELKNGSIRRMTLVGTGALMSPQSIKQGQSIPGVGHLVCLEKRG